MLPLLAVVVSLVVGGSSASIEGLQALDRGVQARAVEALAADRDEACIDELVALWERTDRFDVRSHIVRVFKGMEDEGLHGLVRLTRVSHPYDDPGVSTLLLDALGTYGADAAEALVVEIEEHEGQVGYILSALLRRLGLDGMNAVDRLIRSESARVREQSAYMLYNLGVTGDVTIGEWSDGIIRLITASLADDGGRGAAVRGIVHLPVWREEHRREMPEVYARYVASLRLWLHGRDMQLVRKAIGVLNAQNAFRQEDLALLRSISLDSAMEHWTRVEAIRAYLKHAVDGRRALEEVMGIIEESPMVVCHGLAEVAPEAFTDEMITAIVQALPSSEGREDNGAADLIASSWHGSKSGWPGSNRERIGARAIPALIDALSGEDDELSRHSAWVLERLGGEAVAAIPTLIEQLGTDRGGHVFLVYIRAMMSIAPEGARVREAVTGFIAGVTDDPRHISSAGNGLQDLMRKHPEEEWVRELVRPAMESEEHPLHGFVTHFPPPEYRDVILENHEQLAERIADTRLRDATWLYATGARDVSVDPMELHEEYGRRERALSALSRVASLSPELVEALLVSIRSDILEAEKPPGYGEYDTRDRRAVAKAALWLREQGLASGAAARIAHSLHVEPERYERVIDALSEHPVALSFVLSSYFSDEHGRTTALEVPSTLDPVLIEVMLEALLACRSVERGHSGETGWIVGPLAHLPTDDPRRTEALVEFVRFGSGERQTVGAMLGLGRTRPMTDEVLSEIRLGFDDPRGRVRHAAYRAGAEAGEPGLALLREFVARGDGTVNVDTPPDVEAIAEALRNGDHHVTRMLDEIGGWVRR